MFSNRFNTGIEYFILGRRVFQQKDRHWRGLFLCLKFVYVHFERNENFPLGDQLLLLSVLSLITLLILIQCSYSNVH